MNRLEELQEAFEKLGRAISLLTCVMILTGIVVLLRIIQRLIGDT